jgi:hypothetical protein
MHAPFESSVIFLEQVIQEKQKDNEILHQAELKSTRRPITEFHAAHMSVLNPFHAAY